MHPLVLYNWSFPRVGKARIEFHLIGRAIDLGEERTHLAPRRSGGVLTRSTRFHHHGIRCSREFDQQSFFDTQRFSGVAVVGVTGGNKGGTARARAVDWDIFVHA